MPEALKEVVSLWRVACTACGDEWDHVTIEDGTPLKPREVVTGRCCARCGSYRLHADLHWKRTW